MKNIKKIKKLKINKTLTFTLLLMVSVLLAGCGNQEEVFAPVDVQEGVDRCAVCNMLVPHDHNATELILNDGQPLKFDDIGCMAAWTEENGLDNVNVRYVRDYHTADWLPIEEATFVYDKDFRTPMAYGIYSFQLQADAEAFVEEQGKGRLLSYTDLENHTWERNMELMQEMKQEMGHGMEGNMEGGVNEGM